MGREQTQMWADWTWHQQRHASHDKSVQAIPPLFILQATKVGCGGLGTRLYIYIYIYIFVFPHLSHAQ